MVLLGADAHHPGQRDDECRRLLQRQVTQLLGDLRIRLPAVGVHLVRDPGDVREPVRGGVEGTEVERADSGVGRWG